MPYVILTWLSLLSGVFGLFYTGVAVWVIFADRGQPWRALAMALILFAVSLVAWVLCDLAARLRRIEHELRRQAQLREFKEPPSN